jgi:hypothetical protein
LITRSRSPIAAGRLVAEAYKGVGFERFFHVWMTVVLTLGLLVTTMAFAT